MHVPGSGKNLRTARATPAPALSISASTSTPRANAAFSVSRICAELRIGEFISAAFIVATDEHRLTHFQFGRFRLQRRLTVCRRCFRRCCAFSPRSRNSSAFFCGGEILGANSSFWCALGGEGAGRRLL